MVLCFFLTKVSVICSYFLLFVYFIGCDELTKTLSPVIYHILHFSPAANLVDNLRPLTLELLSRDAKFYLQNAKCGNLILRKIIKLVATRCQTLRLKRTKFNFGSGSAPDPTGGAYSPDP